MKGQEGRMRGDTVFGGAIFRTGTRTPHPPTLRHSPLTRRSRSNQKPLTGLFLLSPCHYNRLYIPIGLFLYSVCACLCVFVFCSFPVSIFI